ncbi:hypothetical protein AXF42_Ash010920 [Apostasia shenzhenica]|uniref:Uncharacterized protein n=1 Tax=Apostasia shenzhenica TaxID=1088818 RepID=A0A2H9ZQK9_9ASPA|nr:hypothetical protein AXF42_Ash010920 [Apostasia shenzhenica]
MWYWCHRCSVANREDLKAKDCCQRGHAEARATTRQPSKHHWPDTKDGAHSLEV